jgi:hypothetical protein
MRDPHVVALYYRFETGPHFQLINPPPIERRTNLYTLRLADGHLCAEIANGPATDTTAYEKLAEYLRSWEIATNLKYGRGTITITFEKWEATESVSPELARLLPKPGGGPPTGTLILRVRGGPASNQYPHPPERFVASPLVVEMWIRYQGFLAGKETLPAMAQYCLDRLEKSTGVSEGRRRAAANLYAIDHEVLRRLGYLTSEVGDARTGRKLGKEVRPHTGAENAWMDAVVTRLIQRVGERAADPNAPWPQITMDKLPRL